MVSKHPILLRALDPEGGVRVGTDEEYLSFVADITALLQVAKVIPIHSLMHALNNYPELSPIMHISYLRLLVQPLALV